MGGWPQVAVIFGMDRGRWTYFMGRWGWVGIDGGIFWVGEDG